MSARTCATSARFCDRCGARIIVAATDDGPRALNPVSNPAGGYLAYQDAAGTWRARVNVTGPKHNPTEKPYLAHGLTCSPPAEDKP